MSLLWENIKQKHKIAEIKQTLMSEAELQFRFCSNICFFVERSEKKLEKRLTNLKIKNRI